MVKLDVITYCSGYNYDVFDRFIGTLNETGFSGKIHIIINNNDKPIIKLLKKKYSNISPISDNIIKKTHINCHRFFCIKVLLEKIKIDADYLLICDSRDVLFQKNPENYSYDDNVDIYGFQEGITIENEKVFNAPWIRMIEVYTKETIYDKICKNKVICCGTTIGKINPMKSYVNKMCEIIETHNIITNLDQGIHNYMLYLNILNVNIKILSNEDNLVNTVGNDIHLLDSSGNILNSKNEISYIVHQYDRFSKDKIIQLSQAKKYNFT